jgi:HNH endonuclease
MKKKTPPQEVLEAIKNTYIYNSETGTVIKNSKSLIPDDEGYTVVNVKLPTIDGIVRHYPTRLHQIVWFLATEYWSEEFIDHIDRDPTNNKITNLRLATNGQNMANAGKRNNKPHKLTSNYKGVSKVNTRWRATIGYQGKTMHLGYFDTPEIAAEAYNNKAKELFGEYFYQTNPHEKVT